MNKKLKQMKKRLCAAGMVIAAAGISVPAAIGALPAESVYAAGDVAINVTNFPDENFMKYVSENIDNDRNGKLSEGEISACKEIYCTWRGINSLKGIEYFTMLENLNCYGNNLSSLDVSKNTALTDFSCGYNNLSSLDVSKNTALKSLVCTNNNLSSLDVSKNTALKMLDCNSNNLSSLDVSKNEALEELGCGGNNLSSLDVSKNTALQELYCYGNNLSSLDVSRNAVLKRLYCSSSNLNSLDVSKNTALEELSCDGNNLSSLDLNKNTLLQELYCYENNLSSLDVSGATSLEWLSCNGNNLSSLDVSKNVALGLLACNGNNLSSLDLSKNTALRYLYCNGNNLSNLDLSKNMALQGLSCYENNLSSLDLSKNTALQELSCYGNNLCSLDVSNNTELWFFSCESQNKEVSVAGGTIALSVIDPDLKASAISNLKGATLSGDKLTNITADMVTYDYATGYNDQKMDVTLNVKHSEVTPESVSIDKKLLVLDKGKSGKLTATVKPDNAKDKTVTWTSSNTNVATVDKDGNVTAVNHGTAKITAKTSNGKTATCEVRVNFIDVTNAKEWYYKPVYWAAENGITTGTDGKFLPVDSCTREQSVTFLWRMAGRPEPKNMNSPYSDVKNKNRYSYKAIMWGTEKGVITGTDGKFYPTGTCTREQIVTMIWRLAGKPEPKNMNSKFKDVTSKTRYSYKAVMWAAEKGITTGTNGLFYPTGQCKRREIVTFIYRYKN